jgi:hypothetical protein
MEHQNKQEHGMRKHCISFAFAACQIGVNGAWCDTLPPSNFSAAIGLCASGENNVENCLEKFNGGLLLPYFGTETKTIFYNATKQNVAVNLLFSTYPFSFPPRETSDEFAWFVLVTDYVHDPGRWNVDYVQSRLPAIVAERIKAGSGFNPPAGTAFEAKPDPQHVPTIFGAYMTMWSTVRLSVPAGYSVWMTRIRIHKAAKGTCGENEEIGVASGCKGTHFRYQLLSIDRE